MKSARGRVPDHFRYRKILPDGRVLRTKVSHGKMQYGPKLWAQTWRTQLGLESSEEFWDCLKSRRPVGRGIDEQPATAGIVRLPIGLVVSLTRVVGLDESIVLAMSAGEAEARWQEFLSGLIAAGDRPTTELDS